MTPIVLGAKSFLEHDSHVLSPSPVFRSYQPPQAISMEETGFER